jgi:hypothetical protein
VPQRSQTPMITSSRITKPVLCLNASRLTFWGRTVPSQYSSSCIDSLGWNKGHVSRYPRVSECETHIAITKGTR